MTPFKTVLRALEKHELRYVIVGGFAAVMCGCNRFTGDIKDLKIIQEARTEQ